MPLTALALIMTVLMGGIIAYNGDVIGRRFGKRRVSVFGLRPKHTAILITSLTGVLISGLTTFFLFLLVPPVRDVIMRGEQAIRTKDRALAEARQAQGDLQRVEGTLRRAHIELDQQRRELTVAQKRADSEEKRGRELSVRNEKLARQNAVLDAMNRKQVAISKGLAEFTRRQRDQSAKLNATNQSLTAENARVRKQTEEMKGAGLEAITRLERMRSRRIIIHTGEELARAVIPASCTAQRARAILGDLMQHASAAALARGAATEGNPRAVRIATKQFKVNQDAAPVQVTEADRINALLDPNKPLTQLGPVRLVGWPHPVCVLALAVGNSVEQEQATIDFQPFENRLVYKQGQTVGTKEVNSDAAPDAVFTSLVDFLKSIGQDALKAGMIPHLDPITGETQVGAFGLPDMVKLLAQVRARGGRVRITAIAKADTSASDTLDLRFDLAGVR